jgi:hypothetical protein
MKNFTGQNGATPGSTKSGGHPGLKLQQESFDKDAEVTGDFLESLAYQVPTIHLQWLLSASRYLPSFCYLQMVMVMVVVRMVVMVMAVAVVVVRIVVIIMVAVVGVRIVVIVVVVVGGL